jgi:16S rRNA processing protein RimM
MREKPPLPTLTLMAEIVGVHGVKGMVKLKVFGGDPESLPAYGAFCDAEGKENFTISTLAQHSGTWLAELKGITDRTAAEKLRGMKLYISRDRLPKIKKKNTWYHADLIGLAARYPDGKPMGTVAAVANFGAGDLLEVQPEKGNSFYVPFTNAVVPDVDLEKKIVIIDPPAGLLD